MSAIYILDSKGRVLINFDYRGEVDFSIPDKFMNYIQLNDKILPDPVFRLDDWCFLYIERESLFFLAVTKSNSNATLLIVFLSNFASLLHEYLNDLTADTIIDNFSLVYELADEVMDYGYPQNLDVNALNEVILKTKPKDLADQPTSVSLKITGVPEWRKSGIEHDINEVFVDVVEKVNVLVAQNGAVIHNEVIGEINMDVRLSGLPELKLGLNDKVIFEKVDDALSKRLFELEDIKFHPCVRLSQFEKDHNITFIPPDGEFNLMTYRLSSQIKPLIQIESSIERHSGSRVELLIVARSQYRAQSIAQNVEIRIPVPHDVDSPKAQCSSGKMRYSPEENVLVWVLKQFPGKKSFQLKAHFGLPSVGNDEDDVNRPVTIKFEIPFFTVSGLRVQFMKVNSDNKYSSTNWVRYMTIAGSCEFRT